MYEAPMKHRRTKSLRRLCYIVLLTLGQEDNFPAHTYHCTERGEILVNAIHAHLIIPFYVIHTINDDGCLIVGHFCSLKLL